MTSTDPTKAMEKRQKNYLRNKDHFTAIAVRHQLIARTRINKT